MDNITVQGVESLSLTAQQSQSVPRDGETPDRARDSRESVSKGEPSAASQRPTAAPERVELQAAVDEANAILQRNHRLRFEVSAENGEFVVQVVDQQSDEVIRSIPPERLSDFRDSFRDATGVLLDDLA